MQATERWCGVGRVSGGGLVVVGVVIATLIQVVIKPQVNGCRLLHFRLYGDGLQVRGVEGLGRLGDRPL